MENPKTYMLTIYRLVPRGLGQTQTQETIYSVDPKDCIRQAEAKYPSRDYCWSVPISVSDI